MQLKLGKVAPRNGGEVWSLMLRRMRDYTDGVETSYSGNRVESKWSISLGVRPLESSPLFVSIGECRVANRK